MTVKSITTIVPLSYNILTTPARFCLFTSKEKRILAGNDKCHGTLQNIIIGPSALSCLRGKIQTARNTWFFRLAF